MLDFARLNDPIPLYADAEYARCTRFGALIALGVMSFRRCGQNLWRTTCSASSSSPENPENRMVQACVCRRYADGQGAHFQDNPAQRLQRHSFKNYKDEAVKKILSLKRQYRGQIHIEIPNIATDHVVDHSDLYEHVYKGFLRCGCGTEHIVISPNGSIRPCQMLPEAPFSVYSENVLCEHIHGDSHKQQLCDAIHKYCNSIGCYTPDSAPCFALGEYLMEENEHAHP